MKLRLDYVTNSSSSSFIIAKHKDCTMNEIRKMLGELNSEIWSLVSTCRGEFNCDYVDANEIKAAYHDNEGMGRAVDLATMEIVCNLFGMDGDLKLGDWDVCREDASNEDGELFSHALYCFGRLMQTEHLKITD